MYLELETKKCSKTSSRIKALLGAKQVLCRDTGNYSGPPDIFSNVPEQSHVILSRTIAPPVGNREQVSWGSCDFFPEIFIVIL